MVTCSVEVEILQSAVVINDVCLLDGAVVRLAYRLVQYLCRWKVRGCLKKFVSTLSFLFLFLLLCLFCIAFHCSTL